jgi:hypothetical protein
MVREVVGWFGRVLILAMPIAFMGQARAEDDVLRRVYAGVQERIHAEYEYNLAGVTRQLLRSGAPLSKLDPVKARMRVLAYNRAALFAYCAADAEKERGVNAPPIPMEQNLPLTTCVEIQIGQLQKFSQLAAYADFFFPERIETCGEQSRMPEREKVLAPYPFLQIDEPKLYDFARYNECLMTR